MDRDATDLLAEFSRGDHAAVDQFLPLLYDELKAIAARQMGHERPDHTLGPTALVNEAYLRLIDQSRVDWQGRNHFCAVAAQLMRRILVDHARKKNALKRKKGSGVLMSVDAALAQSPENYDVDVVALDDLLSDLAKLNERHAKVVELRFFAGLTIEETAGALQISATTVKDDWRVARAWLMARLGPNAD